LGEFWNESNRSVNFDAKKLLAVIRALIMTYFLGLGSLGFIDSAVNNLYFGYS